MQNFFEKKNNTKYSDTLLKEVDGLKLLSNALNFQDKLSVPQVLSVDENILQTQRINNDIPTKKNSIVLGKMLAKMHQKAYKHYGYDQDNYIGLNPQKNVLSNNWGNFFVNYRLGYQVSLIKDKAIKSTFSELLNKNQEKLEEFLNYNTKHPSVLHGDLWNGNVLYGIDKVYLIDPAVYYGDREVDLAMTKMFGGFDKAFYDSYEKEYPLSVEYNTKKVIYNLYHYLNHYNLFGNSYLGGCEDGFEFIEKL